MKITLKDPEVPLDDTEMLAVIRRESGPNRKVDVLIARCLGHRLMNPFLKLPHLVDDIDETWVVVTGREQAPIPRYTGSTDAALRTVGELYDGFQVDCLQAGPNSFRTVLRRSNNFRHVGSAWPTRPLSIIGATFELMEEGRPCA